MTARRRAQTFNMCKLTRLQKEQLENISEPVTEQLPRMPTTRAECRGIPRPCPFVGCKYHLYLDVSHDGLAIKMNFPWMEPGDLPAGGSCALDVADSVPRTLEETGQLMNLTRERVRQIEETALSEASDEQELEILFYD